MKVELCTQAQKEETLDVLCDAFHEYPVMRYVLADSGPDSDGDLRALIDLFCQARLTHGLSLYGIRQEAWDRLGRYDDACEAGDPGQPSHYLGMLGIVSSHQRQGFGKALVAATKELARCSADSRGILLNTETEKNIPYYEKLGFRVVGEADADHVHTWSMFWSCE
tara:strand:+ start:29 stop:526 length:498 start_codon:yes stop_codon:yes gene_type:complete